MGETKVSLLLNTTTPQQDNKASRKTSGVQGEFSTLMYQGRSDITDACMQVDAVSEKQQRKPALKSDMTSDRGESYSRERIIRAQDKALPEDKIKAIQDEVNDCKEDIRDMLKDKFGITDEDIIAAMEEIGITPIELLQPIQLTQLIAQLTGVEDSSELLVNSDYVQVIKDVTTVVDDLLQRVDMSLEELAGLMKDSGIEIKDILERLQAPDTTLNDVVTDDTAEKAGMAVQRESETTFVTKELESDPDKVIADDVTAGTEFTKTVAEVNGGTQVDNTVQKDLRKEIAKDNLDITDNESVQQLGVEENLQTKEASSDQEHNMEQNGEGLSQLYTRSGENEENVQSDPQTEGRFKLDSEDIKEDAHEPVGIHQMPINEAETSGTQPTTMDSSQQPLSYTETARVIEQISEYARTQVTDNGTTVTMQLNPENLGKVYMQVAYKEGVLTAHLAAQNEAVKEAIETQIVQLKENMLQHGLKIEAIDVTVASHEFEKNLEENQQGHNMEHQGEREQRDTERRRRNLNLADEDIQALFTDLSEDEGLSARIMLERGNRMDMHV